ncbi:MAG: asparagine synthase (glutamine-hydrolyzing), partial [Candidatus Saccharimonas sp.]|nr:asparagine synthase (glutamine-hydrolyzing) [Planctomycetaceae bacterium]
MFAAAIWDRTERRLYLVRDRLGEKPLYYGWAGRTLVFGSELHALRKHPDFEQAIDPAAVASLMRFGYVPTPGSIYRNVWKLPPGSILSIDLRNGMPSELPAPEAYWSPCENTHDDDRSVSDQATDDSGRGWVDRLERLLTDVVREQVVADVPLGAFLSGGIDSSAIVALMQAVSSTRVKTYTIGFTEPRFDEAPYARDIARHLGTDHTEWYVTEQMALDVVPRLGHVYDEPFADSSQIPTLLVCQLARRHVTVSLSGDGGDEIFGGYTRYKVFQRAAQLRRLLPGPLKGAAANTLSALSNVFPLSQRWRRRADAAISLLSARDDIAAYARLMSSGRRQAELLRDPRELPCIFDGVPADPSLPLLRRLMLTDVQSYLPDDILVKVDRAAMSTSLETRAPFLDHRVVEFANRLPLNCLERGGESKWVLRELLHRHVPRALTDRPKMGFGIPLAAWMRGALRDWCEAKLSPAALDDAGLFRIDAVQRLWSQHLSGQLDASVELWPLLMFQEWKSAQSVVSEPLRSA